ncbi:hypothetical protein HDZ31DRAFT_43667 [Schizophyllum fasciatum]
MAASKHAEASQLTSPHRYADNVLTTQRIDPILTPGQVATHVHAVIGGSNFGLDLTSSDALRNSSCTSVPIREDKSSYWYPVRPFKAMELTLIWKNGSFSYVDGRLGLTARSDYLFNNSANATTPFPDDFRMISGDPDLRTINASSFAQQAVTFLCLADGGVSRRYKEIPHGECPNGLRSQINFPSCWDGKNVDSADHRSHVAFLSAGPDSGMCEDPAFPYTLPRIFMEVYWITQVWDVYRSQSYFPDQPFVFANGDPTGYGYHADFFNGWEPAALKNALDYCHCNPYGDPSCCVAQGLFTFNQESRCYITDSVDEQTKGNSAALPGANPVQAPCFESYTATSTPAIVGPVYAYDGDIGGMYTLQHDALDVVATPTSATVRASSSTEEAQDAQGTCIYNGAAPVAITPSMRSIAVSVAMLFSFLILHS